MARDQPLTEGIFMPARFLSFSELKTMKGIRWGRMHIDRLERAGKFPRRVRLSTGTVAWLESEIDDYMAEAVAERDATSEAAHAEPEVVPAT
jgi:prophage regulatory protein